MIIKIGDFIMAGEDYFDNRNLVGKKLSDYLRKEGYTKFSFAKLTDISRPTLDRFLSGKIENKVSFDKHFNKILNTLNISGSQLLSLNSSVEQEIHAVYSQNAPQNYKPSKEVKEQFELLSDLITICEIYY